MKLLKILSILVVFLYSINTITAEQRSSISQYGITWTFNSQYECGQFVTGDWWVVGPVTITSVSPAPTGTRNGSCVNPMGGRQGYDDRADDVFSTADNVTFPYTLQPNQSLVSSDSKPEGVAILNVGCLLSQAVLTCVSSPPASGTFRPSYAGTYKQYYNVSQIQWQILPNLPPPSSVLNGQDLIRYMDRPRIDHMNNWEIQKGCAQDNWINGPDIEVNHPCYGADYSKLVSDVALYVMLNTSERDELVRSMIQIGIDNYGVLKAGGGWKAAGGHHNARKYPIVFAARLLNASDMLQVGYEYSGNTFSQDAQTYYGVQGTPLWGQDTDPQYFLNGCSGSGSKDARDPAGLVDGCPDYRDYQTSRTWPGQMLSILMIDARSIWNHDAFFDYVDRWMSGGVPGEAPIASGEFDNDMWDLYRDNLPSGGGLINVTGISLAPSSITLDEGMSQQLTETVTPSDATNKIVSWSSSNSAVAAVSSSGAVSGIAPGNATITATTNDGGFTATCAVTVNSIGTNVALNKSISVSAYQDNTDGIYPGTNLVDGDVSDATRWSATGFPQWAEIDLGADYSLSRIDVFPYQDRPYQYIIEGKPDGGSYSTIVDRSANTESADNLYDNVSATVRYLKITVSGVSGNITTWVSLAELKAFVNGGTVPVTGVSLSPTSITIDEGQSSSLTATVSPSNATNQSVAFSSNNTAVATVDASGVVSALSSGQATITATTADGGFTATCAVTVSEVQPPTGNVYYCSPSGSMSNNGTSISTPWASLEDVFAAGKTFIAGDVIYLMDGNHGIPVITGNNSGDVTIMPTPGANAQIEEATIQNASHWVISGLTVSPEIAGRYKPGGGTAFIVTIGSTASYITIEDCYMYSTSSSTIAGLTGSQMYDMMGNFVNVSGQNCTIQNNTFKEGRFMLYIGVTGTGSLISNNLFEGIMEDGIRITADDCIIENNTIRQFYGVDESHDDAIQSWAGGSNPGTGAISNVTVRNNIIIAEYDANQPFHSIYGVDGIGCFDGYFNNWLVENNLIVTDMWHGITFMGANNTKVINNTILKNPLNLLSKTPWITITNHKDGTSGIGNIMRNNISSLAPGTGYHVIGTTTENNIITTDYSTYLVDFANFNFHLAQNSPAIDAGTSATAPSTDLDGVTRPQGAGYDVGCYEYIIGGFVPVTGVSVSPTTLSLNVGQSSDLSETVTPANATDPSVNWSSSNTSVATVDTNGVVSALSSGQATITVTTVDGSYTATSNVTVTEITQSAYTTQSLPGKVQIEDYDLGGQDVAYNELDGDKRLDASIRPADQVDLKYTSDVDGNINIGWTADGEWLEYTLANVSTGIYDISVRATSDFAAPGNLVLSLGDGPDGTNLSQIATITINNTGGWDAWQTFTVTGVSITGGSNKVLRATISGSGFDINWVDFVINSTVPVTGVSVSPVTLTLDEGQSSALTETVSPADATDKSVSWSSSNTSVATVDANGLVSALSSGQATISVTTVDGGFTANCSVTVTDGQQTTTTLNPVADAAVRGGTYENDNYGTSANLTVKNDAVSYTRESFLKFDLSGISQSVSSAILRLYVSDDGVSTHTAKLVSDDTWTETGITWANKPASGSAIASWDVTATGNYYIEADITSAVVSEAGQLLSMNISASNNDYIYYSSKEATNKPELVITMGSATVPVTGVSVAPASLSLEEGQSSGLTETISPVDATDQTVSWSSSDNSVATVDANGVVSALRGGQAIITVTTTDGAYTANCTVTVTVPVTGVSVTPATLELDEGQTSALTAAVSPADASDPSVTWSTSNPLVATVDASGLVSALSGGQTTITATTNDGGYTATCEVIVTVPVTGVSVTPATLELDEGQTSALTAAVSPADASDPSVTWSTSNPLVATVDASGLVSALSGGQTTITATTNDGGYTATCAVNVATIILQTITLNPVADAYVRGGTYENDNYGTSTSLTVKDATESYTRESFIKFDLSGISLPVTSAVLRLYVADEGVSTHTAKFVSDDSWTETGITYANKPLSGSVIASWDVEALGNYYIETDISSAVIAEAGGLLSMHITAGNSDYIYYDSKEATHKPELVITSSVTIVPVTGVIVSPTILDLVEGQTYNLEETVLPVDAYDPSVTWSSSNSSVATVDAGGVVSAQSSGQTTISVTTTDGGYTANCSVTVTAPQTRTETIVGSEDDQEIRTGGGSQWVGYDIHRVGGAGSTYDGLSVHPFQLPVLNAGEIILDASFSVDLYQVKNSPPCHVDLYGIPYRSTSGVSSSGDYWQGAYGNDPNATELQDDFATASSPSGAIVTNASGNNNLVDYINAQYDAGAQGGDYIFLRLNPDITDVADYKYWEFYSADSPYKPVLDLQIGIIPSKSAIAKQFDVEADQFELKVYPNPVSGGLFYIELKGATNNSSRHSDEKVTVSLFDIAGKLVINKKVSLSDIKQVNKITCNAPLKKGMYLIKVSGISTQKVEKLIVE